jgi:glycosyltransferase involved in cell wall biosynthesis
MSGLDLAVLMLTKNEELNLPVALSSLRSLGATIYVIDSNSSDRTRAIAEEAGCTVVPHPFVTQADQVNWALDNLSIENTWIMRLDADERLTPALVEELRAVLPDAPQSTTGFKVKRRVYFWGRWIRHGGYYPTWLFRIWRRGTARSETRWVDEHMVSSGGHIEQLVNDIIDENHKGLSFWTEKHNAYADREVLDLLATNPDIPTIQVDGQAGRRRWMKQNFYSRCPRFVRAFAYWLLRYFLLLGFLDGKPGLVFHFLQALWYRFLIDAKLEEHMRILSEQTQDASGKSAGPELL